MAIKKLQNDFTTPEQSQRLSKLGVPTDSANGILLHYAWAEENLDEKNWETPRYLENDLPASQALDMYLTDQDEYDIAIPCWSVGRLIKIVNVCCTDDNVKDEIAIEVMYSNKNSAQLIIEMMSEYTYIIDFSKLEE